MSKLEELIRELCPDGVEYKTIGEIANISRGKVMSKDYLRENKGEYPVYSSQTENNGMLGAITTYAYDGEYLTWTTDGANAGTVFYRTGKFSITNVCGLIDNTSSNVNTKYLYYVLNKKAPNYVSSGMGNPKLMSNVMSKITIPIPPLEVQKEIVRLLDEFTAKTAELQAELNNEYKARKKQYEYQKEKLLTHNNDAITYTISELCSVSAGGDAPKNAMSKEITKEYTIPIISNGVRENAIYGYTNKARICEPAVTLAARGTIGYAEYRDYPYVPIIRLLNLIPKNTQVLDTKYLYYCLADKKYTLPTTGIPQLTAPMVKKIEISVPKIEIQKEIVKILDEYNIFYRDLQDNLNNEIESRQKQYEFYRDKLLTFKELK